MQDPQYFSLGQPDGTEVVVQHTLDGQDILIERTDTGMRLARLLGARAVESVRQGDTTYWHIPHTPQIDRLLVELTDLFISIRYARPTLVQLELELEPAAP